MRQRLNPSFIDPEPHAASANPQADTHILKVPHGTSVNVTVVDRSAIPGGWHSGFNRVYEWGYFAKLSPAAKAVYKVLEWRADYNNAFMINAGPDGRGLGYTGIARYAGVSVESVKRAMSELAALDMVRTIRRQRYFKGGEAPNAPKQYQLTVPAIPASEHIADLDPETRKNLYRNGQEEPRERSPATPPSGRHRPDPLLAGERTLMPSASRRSSRAAPDHGVADHRILKNTESKNKRSSRTTTDVRGELEHRGVGEPMLSRILDSTSAETIRQHLLDFDLRNMLPGHPRKNAGWLAKAILVPYALHDRTHEQIESGKKLTQAQLHRQKQATTKAAEDARLAAIDAWAEEQFSSADDEELELLRAKVIAEYGSVARGLEKVDARTHPRLSRLIKGVLSQLYQG